MNHFFTLLSVLVIFLCGIWAVTIFRIKAVERIERQKMIHDTQERAKDRQLQREIMKAQELRSRLE